MFDMLVVQSNGGLTPLTPVSTPQSGHHHHPTDLSPRSARSTSSSLLSDSPTSSSPTPTPIKDFHHHHHLLQEESRGVGFEDFSALQRLQYALERNSLFSNLFQNGSPNGKLSPNHTELTLKTSRHEVEDDDDEDDHEQEGVQRQKQILDNLNVSLEDSGPRSTDSSSNMIESPTGSPTTNPTNIFQCPACSIVCNGRHSFNEHLVTHTNQRVCPKCDFLTSTEENMRDHLQEVHDLTDPDGLTDDEARIPKMNSQGKMKTFKCKQCQHISITKLEFWSHSKSHIRQEKMLTCPKCEFVTEYKHHLEYHLRNHFGSKPFQCTECSYSCVNKSMLNSHLKSHSTVYQYRCADCSYATKYCHSLKLHLRKYSHNPSAVLNPDGSQNPLTIIDVYGTRRGPKIKRLPPGSDNTQMTKIIQSQVSPNSTDRHENKNSKGEDYNTEISPTSAITITRKETNNNFEPQTKRFSSDTSDSMSDSELRQHQHQHVVMPVTEMNRTNYSQFQNPIHIGDPKAILEQMSSKSPLEFYAAALNQYIFANPILRMQPVQDLAKRVAKEQQDQILSHVLAAAQQQVQQQQQHVEIKLSPHPPVHIQSNHTPLDLRQNSVGIHQNSVDERERYYEGQNFDDMKKRKRKGKAHRYDRQQLIPEDLRQQDEGKALDFSNNNNSKIEKKDVSNLICKYCEISFLDQVLYSMHMSYHSGDADPFLCRSCGKKTPNKIAFSVHLTTDPH